MKIKAIIISVLIMFFGAIQANAGQLPRDMKNYLLQQKHIPSVRYDGIVVYNKDLMYLPVLPAHPQKVDSIQITRTIPANKNMDSFPDLVIFNNNYTLLKMYRTGEDSLTVKYIPDLPEVVKTGLIPQDIMVPRGLVLPENLAGILGDIPIPLVGSAKSPTLVSGRRPAPLPTGKRIADIKPANVPAALKNTLFFVNNFQTEYLEVFSSTVSEPLYSLKTSGVMKDVKPVLGGKFLLAATNNMKNVDVIDVENEYVAKHIDLTAQPSEIAIDTPRNKAYIASITDESLFVIDLENMSMTEKIQLVGAPQRISISEDGTKIAYVDMKTSNIYILDLENNYENKLITNYPNTTKIILDKEIMYLISRTAPKLRMVHYDLYQDNKYTKTKKDKIRDKARKEADKENEAENVTDDIYSVFQLEGLENEEENELVQKMKIYATSIKDVNVGTKPVDMYRQNGIIYVLCAGDNTVYSYNIATDSISMEKLPVGGFSKAFTPVPNSNLAIITNMSDLKYVVYDMDSEKAVQTLPISEYINTITVLERKNGQ
jgi:DNA-binding beta-propeller fold protein YncE